MIRCCALLLLFAVAACTASAPQKTPPRRVPPAPASILRQAPGAAAAQAAIQARGGWQAVPVRAVSVTYHGPLRQTTYQGQDWAGVKCAATPAVKGTGGVTLTVWNPTPYEAELLESAVLFTAGGRSPLSPAAITPDAGTGAGIIPRGVTKLPVGYTKLSGPWSAACSLDTAGLSG